MLHSKDCIGQPVDYAKGHNSNAFGLESCDVAKELATTRNQVLKSDRQAGALPMSISDHAAESEQELRWRVWQEKRRRSDQVAAERIRILFCAVVAILAGVILYYWLRPNAPSKSSEPVVASGNSLVDLRIHSLSLERSAPTLGPRRSFSCRDFHSLSSPPTTRL